MKRLLTVAVIAFCLNVLVVDSVDARRFGGSFKFSSSKSYMKPKWGGSKKSFTSTRSTTRQTTTSSSRQPGFSGTSNRGTSGVSSRARQSRLSSQPTNHFKSTRQQTAYSNYQSRERSRFKGSTSSTSAGAASTTSRPLYKNAANNAGSRSGDYWDRRNNHYGGWDAPNYVYGGAARLWHVGWSFLGLYARTCDDAFLLPRGVSPSERPWDAGMDA